MVSMMVCCYRCLTFLVEVNRTVDKATSNGQQNRVEYEPQSG